MISWLKEEEKEERLAGGCLRSCFPSLRLPSSAYTRSLIRDCVDVRDYTGLLCSGLSGLGWFRSLGFSFLVWSLFF